MASSRAQGLGRWSKVSGVAEAAIRNLPPSAIGDLSNLDVMGLLAANKGSPMQGIVEQVRDGSTVRVYLLPDFQFVQVFVAGIQVQVLIHDFFLFIFIHYMSLSFKISTKFSCLLRPLQWVEGLL